MDNIFSIMPSPELHFGWGNIKELPYHIKKFGINVLALTGKSSFVKTYTSLGLFQELDLADFNIQLIAICGEPSPEDIDTIVESNREPKPDVVVAIGGGSVIDAGKAISAMLCETGCISDYLEDVGTKKPSGNKIPFIALPTTSGTGSEATSNAVITKAGANGYKKSLRHVKYVPNIAIVDPSLTLFCPPSITASSGMDTFSQLLEAYLSAKSNIFTDIIAFEGIKCVLNSLENVFDDGYNEEGRIQMSYAAYLSGLAISNAGLGLVHGFAQPLGSLFSLPHGVVCGSLMGATNRITVESLRKVKNKSVLDKYFNVSKIISEETDKDKSIDCLLGYIDNLISKFNIPKLSEFGISKKDLPTIIKGTGMKSHPIELSSEDLERILKERL